LTGEIIAVVLKVTVFSKIKKKQRRKCVVDVNTSVRRVKKKTITLIFVKFNNYTVSSLLQCSCDCNYFLCAITKVGGLIIDW
jgi:hypothetical protein